MGKYEEKIAPRIEEICVLAKNGKTDKDIAAAMGVSYSAFREYKKAHEELKTALDRSKAVADKKVEESLFERALGKIVKLKRPIKIKAGKDKEEVIEAEYEEYIPADTTAIIFWLCNRKPDVWRRKQDVTLEGTDGKGIEVRFSTKEITNGSDD